MQTIHEDAWANKARKVFDATFPEALIDEALCRDFFPDDLRTFWIAHYVNLRKEKGARFGLLWVLRDVVSVLLNALTTVVMVFGIFSIFVLGAFLNNPSVEVTSVTEAIQALARVAGIFSFLAIAARFTWRSRPILPSTKWHRSQVEAYELAYWQSKAVAAQVDP